MIIFIQITSFGPEVGPFNLYSNVDGYIYPFAVGVPKEELEVGQVYEVPDGTVIIRVMSTGTCDVYEDQIIDGFTTTTTSTTANPIDWLYYGVVTEPGGFPDIPTSVDIDIEGDGTYIGSGASAPIVVPFNSDIDDFLWFAIPVLAGTKDHWYVSLYNQGDIGGPVSMFGNLFSDPTIVNISGINHYLYISTVRTNVTSITIS